MCSNELKSASEVESIGKELSVNLILNVIEVRFRFIGTHFDHNHNIIKIFIYCLSRIGPYMGLCTSFGPPPRTGRLL